MYPDYLTGKKGFLGGQPGNGIAYDNHSHKMYTVVDNCYIKLHTHKYNIN